MSYQKLYAFAQTLAPPIGRNNIRDKVCELTGVERIAVRKTTLDVSKCRGFYLSARNTNHPFVAQHGGHVIVLAREGLNRCWERFVAVKEMMHMFDGVDEATDSGEVFDQLLAEFITPRSERSPQMNSEIKCVWMALGALCPEAVRQQLMVDRQRGHMDDYGIALKLRIPQQYIPALFNDRFLDYMRSF